MAYPRLADARRYPTADFTPFTLRAANSVLVQESEAALEGPEPGAVPLVVAAGARFPTLAASPRDGILFVAYESTAQNRPGLFVEVVR